MSFFTFLFILTHISLGLLFLGNAESDVGWGEKLNAYLMTSCVQNIRSQNINIRV